MSDAIKELCEMLRATGARVTFDRGRSITHPCTFCATPAAPHHELVTIGKYGNGDDLTRPVCKKCMRIADLVSKPLLPAPPDDASR